MIFLALPPSFLGMQWTASLCWSLLDPHSSTLYPTFTLVLPLVASMCTLLLVLHILYNSLCLAADVTREILRTHILPQLLPDEWEMTSLSHSNWWIHRITKTSSIVVLLVQRKSFYACCILVYDHIAPCSCWGHFQLWRNFFIERNVTSHVVSATLHLFCNCNRFGILESTTHREFLSCIDCFRSSYNGNFLTI